MIVLANARAQSCRLGSTQKSDQALREIVGRQRPLIGRPADIAKFRQRDRHVRQHEDERPDRDRSRGAGLKHDRAPGRLPRHQRDHGDIDRDRRLQLRGDPRPDRGKHDGGERRDCRQSRTRGQKADAAGKGGDVEAVRGQKGDKARQEKRWLEQQRIADQRRRERQEDQALDVPWSLDAAQRPGSRAPSPRGFIAPSTSGQSSAKAAHVDAAAKT